MIKSRWRVIIVFIYLELYRKVECAECEFEELSGTVIRHGFIGTYSKISVWQCSGRPVYQQEGVPGQHRGYMFFLKGSNFTGWLVGTSVCSWLSTYILSEGDYKTPDLVPPGEWKEWKTWVQWKRNPDLQITCVGWLSGWLVAFLLILGTVASVALISIVIACSLWCFRRRKRKLQKSVCSDELSRAVQYVSRSREHIDEAECSYSSSLDQSASIHLPTKMCVPSDRSTSSCGPPGYRERHTPDMFEGDTMSDDTCIAKNAYRK